MQVSPATVLSFPDGAVIQLAAPGSAYLAYSHHRADFEIQRRRALGTAPTEPLPLGEALSASVQATIAAGCVTAALGWTEAGESISSDPAGWKRLLDLPPVWSAVTGRLEALARETERRLKEGEDLLVAMVRWDVKYGGDLESYREWAREAEELAEQHRVTIRNAQSVAVVREVLANLPADHRPELAAGATLQTARGLAFAAVDGWAEGRYPEALRCRPTAFDPFVLEVHRSYWQLQGDRQTIVVPMGGALPGSPTYSGKALYFLSRQIGPADQLLYERYWAAMEAAAQDERGKAKAA